MTENNTTLRRARFSPGRLHRNSGSFLALGFCLVLVSFLSGGCMVGAAVGLMSAATEAGVLAETALEAALDTGEPESVVLRKETDVFAGPGEEYERIATLHEGAEILVLGHQGYWVECQWDECEDGWIRCPCAPDR